MREREEIVKGSNNFVRPIEIFEISRFEISRAFLRKEVRNVQGTKEFVQAFKKFRDKVKTKIPVKIFGTKHRNPVKLDRTREV